MKSVRKTVWFFTHLIWLAFTSTSLSASEPQTILIMGDSISAAYGMEEQHGWVNLLQMRLTEQKLTHISLANASISGETTGGGLRRLPELLSRHQPDIVIIELGANDGLRGFPPTVIAENLRQMISLSQETGAKVVLVGMKIPPNYGNRYTKAFAAVYPQLAKELTTALMPFFLINVFDGDAMMQSDGIHPSAKGQPQLLENIWPILKPLLQD